MNLYEAGLILSTAIGDHRPVKRFALFSGGHDSLTSLTVAAELIDLDGVVHVRTGTGIPETFRYVEERVAALGLPLYVCRPPLDEATGEEGAEYRDMVLRHGFPGPGQGAHRVVYVRLKEKALYPFVRAHKTKRSDRLLFVTGVRRQESQRRMGTVQPISRDGAVVWAAPILNWTADDCGAWMEQEGLHRNLVKDLLHISGECLCGCFAKPGEREEIATWYPDVAARIRRWSPRLPRRACPAAGASARRARGCFGERGSWSSRCAGPA